MGQTNEQQRDINEWPISELNGDWGGRFHPNQLKTTFLHSSKNGMSSLLFSLAILLLYSPQRL
jgi:hypothetical protein